MIITLDMLKDRKGNSPCPSWVSIITKAFPNGAEITIDNVRKLNYEYQKYLLRDTSSSGSLCILDWLLNVCNRFEDCDLCPLENANYEEIVILLNNHFKGGSTNASKLQAQTEDSEILS